MQEPQAGMVVLANKVLADQRVRWVSPETEGTLVHVVYRD